MVYNHTNKWLDNASVNYRNFKSGGGIMRPGAKKKYAHAQQPIPEDAMVVWTDPSGKWHEVEVKVASQLPNGKNYHGIIIFQINPDDTISIDLENHAQNVFQ